MSLKATSAVEVVPMPDGTFRAVCPAIEGAFADGATPAEAEKTLLALIETRFEDQLPMGKREPVDLDPDSDDDEDPSDR